MAVQSSAQTGDPAEVPIRGSASADAGGLPVPGTRSQGFALLDRAAMDALVEELGTPDIAGNFARDYAGMWKQRQARLQVSVEQEDVEAAIHAVISLQVTSATAAHGWPTWPDYWRPLSGDAIFSKPQSCWPWSPCRASTPWKNCNGGTV